MKEDSYKRALKDLTNVANIEGSIIVSRDGMLIYSNMKDVHAEAFSAMLATILSSAEVAMDEIKASIPQMVVVNSKNKKIIVVGAGASALLASITTAPADDIYNTMEKASREIEKIFCDKK